MANQYRSVLSGGASTGGDAIASEVLSGKTFTNDNGPQTGTMTNNGAVSQTLGAGESYTIPEGYHNGSGVVTAKSVTKLSQVAFTRSSDPSICTADISSLYSDYQNITIDNIVCQLYSTSVGSVIQLSTFTYTYDSLTGVITIEGDPSAVFTTGGNTKFDIFIIP